MEILYEDKDILAINKPAGLVVHSDGRTIEPSVTEWFVDKYPRSKDVGEPLRGIHRPGVVHRIDRETSGVLLLAKTKEGFESLKRQFKGREVRKVYHAFVYGLMKQDHGSISLPIGRSASDFRRRSAQGGARGEKREALTYFKVLMRSKDDEVTFLEARPKTGRTHQIRVHFQALHHPIVCDKLYGGRRSRGQSDCALGFLRLALHAKSTTFSNLRGEEIGVEAPYPEDFREALDRIGARVLD